MKKIGILGSTGGSAFRKSLELLQCSGRMEDFSFMIVTDRECGIELVADEYQFPRRRIDFAGKGEFSALCCREFQQSFQPDAIVLFFSRLIGPELFRAIPCVNLHPALLPAFPGLTALEDAYRSGVRFLGATLHNVDETADTGKIIAQTVMPIAADTDRKTYYDFSHIQIIYLFLLFCDGLAQDVFVRRDNNFIFSQEMGMTERCNPRLIDTKLEDVLNAYQKERNLHVI